MLTILVHIVECVDSVIMTGVMVRRGRYNRYSAEVREKVRSAYDNGEDWLKVASILGVKRQTADYWVQAWESGTELPGRNKLRKRSLNEAEVNELVRWVESDPTVTLSMLRLRLSAEFNKEVSLTTVANYLNGQLLTLKKLHPISETMNTFENKKLRRKYVLRLLQSQAEGRQIVWIDETNFNLFCCRTRGRSRKGTRARVLMSSSKGKNLHIISAVSSDGLLKFTTKRGSYTSIACSQWIRDLLVHLHNIGINNPTIVCDNAPCHAHLEYVFEEEQFSNATLLRLGPYSPALNPVEGEYAKTVHSLALHFSRMEYAEV